MTRSFIFLFVVFSSITASAVEKPNILWLTCEDISPYLGCYGYEQAKTPNLDKLARDGVLFSQAYSNAPVCGVARSTLLTGMYPVTTGTHNFRSLVTVPDCIPAYPQLFRDAGYYCTNNVKTDYNSSYEMRKGELWDETSHAAHWKNRPQDKPFFAVFNSVTTHEGKLSEKMIKRYAGDGTIPVIPRIALEDVELPPYHPDLPEIRSDWARLYDLITAMDHWVGEKLQEVKDAGLEDDTIVFFYSDHGGQLARSKRYLYQAGTRVPLIVYVPNKWKHLAAAGPGTTFDAIAQFVDIPKTALSLAGIQAPELMQGRVLFGPEKEEDAAYAFLYRDRMGDRPDCSRGITDGRYQLIRNFMPHRPNGRDTGYVYTVQSNWRAWRDWYDSNPEAASADTVRSQFFKPKPVLEFFDNQSDPWNIENLTNKRNTLAIQKRLEDQLDEFMIKSRDCGLIPEAMVNELIGDLTLYEYAQSKAYPIARILDAAKIAGAANASNLDALIDMLNDEHPVIRFWGAYGLFYLKNDRDDVQSHLKSMAMDDLYAANRIMAGQALGMCGLAPLSAKILFDESMYAQDGIVFLFAINAIDYASVCGLISPDNWDVLKKIEPRKVNAYDKFNWEYGKRLVGILEQG